MRIGIDLGGTKTEGVLLDERGRVVARERVATPSASGYEAVLDTVAALVGELRARSGAPCPVGVGIPGCISTETGRVKNSNSTALNGRRLHDDLEARLGQRVRVMNDANCFAVAESLHGAGRGARVVFGVILGTGVGGGLVIDGEPRIGLHGVAGEWGHSPIGDEDPQAAPAPRCYCGQRGCVETRLSGPGFAADHERLGGPALQAPEVLARAEAGEPVARRALARYLAFFGEALARVIHILDPDAIVLGGGMANNPRLYDRGVEEVEARLFSERLLTPIRRHELGDSAGVFGAAWLWGRTPLQIGSSGACG